MALILFAHYPFLVSLERFPLQSSPVCGILYYPYLRIICAFYVLNENSNVSYLGLWHTTCFYLLFIFIICFLASTDLFFLVMTVLACARILCLIWRLNCWLLFRWVAKTYQVKTYLGPQKVQTFYCRRWLSPSWYHGLRRKGDFDKYTALSDDLVSTARDAEHPLFLGSGRTSAERPS